MSHARIARDLGVSRTTVVKYATRDYSPSAVEARAGSRSLVAGEYARAADAWLTADLRMPRKQRHTARRVHERLVAECGFRGSYSSVQRWVKRWREARRAESDGYAELEWAPGTAQVDFGQALAVIAGAERKVHYLAVSFPYSNMRYVVALPGETAECVCEGLSTVFERAGMAPRVVVFDNATGAAHRRADGTVTQTRLFSLFCAHYGFEPRFCNPGAGHEKGSVENAVGFVRRNLMVPRPAAESHAALTRAWLDRCDAIAREDHYRRGVPVADLFDAERDGMLPLPGVRFDACDWRSVRADRTGAVLIDGNRYLAGPGWRSARIQAGVRAFEVELRGPGGEPIVTLDRVWGHEPRTVMEPSTLLAIIARKPRVWGESPIRGDFPGNVRDLLDRMDGRERAALIDDIRNAADSHGFAAAAGAVSAIIDAGRPIDRASIDQTARRIAQGHGAERGPDLTRYNTYMEER